ncbi:hypothetical protein [Streptosporangium saharense]|uniref:Uncharacterized protein n=1 Tax=Streptosporangium saharense TaxID=1706840 RepID=A0A7W7QT51_9ACTN|nr:hypothetical protein [Streptosporangium saharense]MBB4919269.1 hypothetical protein [Streptosporangium saharense]
MRKIVSYLPFATAVAVTCLASWLAGRPGRAVPTGTRRGERDGH